MLVMLCGFFLWETADIPYNMLGSDSEDGQSPLPQLRATSAQLQTRADPEDSSGSSTLPRKRVCKRASGSGEQRR